MKRKMNKQTIITPLLIAIMGLTSCGQLAQQAETTTTELTTVGNPYMPL